MLDILAAVQGALDLTLNAADACSLGSQGTPAQLCSEQDTIAVGRIGS